MVILIFTHEVQTQEGYSYLLGKGMYYCTAELLFDWVEFNQKTSVANVYVAMQPILSNDRLFM